MFNFILQKIIKKIGNRFDLVLISSFRARQIQLFLKDDYLKELKYDKSTILSIKEINNELIYNNKSKLFFLKK